MKLSKLLYINNTKKHLLLTRLLTVINKPLLVKKFRKFTIKLTQPESNYFSYYNTIDKSLLFNQFQGRWLISPYLWENLENLQWNPLILRLSVFHIIILLKMVIIYATSSWVTNEPWLVKKIRKFILKSVWP